MHLHLKDLQYFLIGVVIPSYQLVAWLSQLFGKGLRRVFIRSERQAAVFVHAKLHTAGQGHTPKSPIECTDGDCVKVS